MIAPTVSVIVVSQTRPTELDLCLKSLCRLDYAPYEIVVVCDTPSISGLASFDGSIKIVRCDTPNISKARNLGLMHAAGEIVAFIDDDAVAEPQWLAHLVTAFSDERVSAAGGFVRGANGISYQWKARMAFPDGTSLPMPSDEQATQVFDAIAGRAIKTEGTNMAFRRRVLEVLGGFDEAFAFYLDETDMNMRLAAAGHATAIVPLAQVHHRFAASARRNSGRVPRDLTQIAASLAVFRAKHAADQPETAVRKSHESEQRRRLLTHMVHGRLTPSDVGKLMKTFRNGWVEGKGRRSQVRPITSEIPPFLPYFSKSYGAEHVVLLGRFWQRRRLMVEAASHASAGKHVSLFLFSATTLFHHVVFTGQSFWLQTGGQFGRSVREKPLFQWFRQRERLRAEVNRIELLRKNVRGSPY